MLKLDTLTEGVSGSTHGVWCGRHAYTFFAGLKDNLSERKLVPHAPSFWDFFGVALSRLPHEQRICTTDGAIVSPGASLDWAVQQSSADDLKKALKDGKTTNWSKKLLVTSSSWHRY